MFEAIERRDCGSAGASLCVAIGTLARSSAWCNGRQTPKVFKLSKRTLAPGQRLQLRKKHSFRPVTTRKYYPGAQALELQINGRRFGRVAFELT